MNKKTLLYVLSLAMFAIVGAVAFLPFCNSNSFCALFSFVGSFPLIALGLIFLLFAIFQPTSAQKPAQTLAYFNVKNLKYGFYFTAAIVLILPALWIWWQTGGQCEGLACVLVMLGYVFIYIFALPFAAILYFIGTRIGNRGGPPGENAASRWMNSKKVSSAFLLFGLLIISLARFKVYRFINFDDEFGRMLNFFLYLTGGVILLSAVQSLWKAWKK